MGRRDSPDEFKADAIRLVLEQRYFFAQACDALSAVVSYLSKFNVASLTGTRHIASTQSIYNQDHVASRAAEEARGYMLRASRAQKMLLTATSAKERDKLGVDIDRGLSSLAAQLGTLQQYVDASNATTVDQ